MTTTTPQSLLQVALAALQAPGATVAGARVFGPRDWPTGNEDYPCILVRIMSDQKTSLSRNSVSFLVVTTLMFVCRCSGPAGDDDLGATVAEEDAWALERQVEVAIVNAPSIAPLVQQFTTMNTEMVVRSEGETTICDVGISIGFEYRMDANDFAPVVGTEITEMTLATTSTDFSNSTQTAPGVDLTYSP